MRLNKSHFCYAVIDPYDYRSNWTSLSPNTTGTIIKCENGYINIPLHHKWRDFGLPAKNPPDDALNGSNLWSTGNSEKRQIIIHCKVWLHFIVGLKNYCRVDHRFLENLRKTGPVCEATSGL